MDSQKPDRLPKVTEFVMVAPGFQSWHNCLNLPLVHIASVPNPERSSKLAEHSQKLGLMKNVEDHLIKWKKSATHFFKRSMKI